MSINYKDTSPLSIPNFKKGWIALLLPVALFLLAFGASSPEAGETCAGTSAELQADGSDRAVLCDAARHAEQFMGTCGLAPRRTYRLRIDPSLCNVRGEPIFGQFEPNGDIAFVRPIQGCAGLMKDIPIDESMSALKLLPIKEVYRSFIVHEVAHAIAHQHFEVRPTRSSHEYISAVAQIRSLSEASRTTFLATIPDAQITTEMLNDLTLAMDPGAYAAAAYRHFNSEGNGCSFIRRLLREEAVLPTLP